MQPGDLVTYITPDQHDDDAVAEVLEVQGEDLLKLHITFSDGAEGIVNFCPKGDPANPRPGRWIERTTPKE